MDLLEMTKEAAYILGCLQNDTIVGLNSDQQTKIKAAINRSVRDLIELRPSICFGQWSLRMQPSIDLGGASTNTCTGSKDIPILSDSAQTLKSRELYRIVTDGASHHRVVGVSGATLTLEDSLFAAATTADGWTAYMDTYPLPANIGDILRIVYEDGEDKITITNSKEQFIQIMNDENKTSRPEWACLNFWKNRFAEYKYSESAVTAANGSRILIVPTINCYELGDVLQVDTGTTDNYVFTITGVDTTNRYVYLDRPYNGGATSVTVYTNPNKYTEYITFYGYPSAERDLKMFGWLQPQDMVADADECVIREDLCSFVVLHSLLMNKFFAQLVSKEYLAYYDRGMKRWKSRKKAELDDFEGPPGGWRNRTDGDYASDFSYE